MRSKMKSLEKIFYHPMTYRITEVFTALFIISICLLQSWQCFAGSPTATILDASLRGHVTMVGDVTGNGLLDIFLRILERSNKI